MGLVATLLAAAPLELSISGCAETEASELRRIVASELANARSLQVARASVDCRAGVADVRVEVTTHEYTGRVIELTDSDPSLRARTLALAVVELAGASQSDAQRPHPTSALSPPPLPQPEEIPELRDEVPPPSPPRVRSRAIAGYGLVGLATVAGVAAGVFGGQAQALRSKLDSASINSLGQVVSMTQRTAFALEQQLASLMIATDVLAGVAIVAFGVGLGFIIYDVKAAVMPSGQGVALCGSF
jgi:hypothetical protein